jgi:hypothetical protein
MCPVHSLHLPEWQPPNRQLRPLKGWRLLKWQFTVFSITK